MIGHKIHDLAKNLWSFNRSITGDGLRETLNYIKKNHLSDLKIHSEKTGQKVFDWTIPKEWKIRDAYIITPSGKKICEFKKNNLHIVGYSIPVNQKISLKELQNHLHSLTDLPTAVPYVTSYYQEYWGFCISDNERKKLKDGDYEVVIDSELLDGFLDYGELILKGRSSKEIFLSTYVCHPSMANNELSGPTVTTYLAKWLTTLTNRKFTYRIIFIPETIGSLTYLSKNLEEMKKNVYAGFNISCVGDDRSYSYLPSRNGNTISDRIAKHVLKNLFPRYINYGWMERGSDERQYCAPGIDLPIASIMRTKYGEYPEYHSSLDDLLNVVTPDGLEGGYRAIKLALQSLENNFVPKSNVLGEPNLGKRGLYPLISENKRNEESRLMVNILSLSDGDHDLIEISEKCNQPIWKLIPIVEKLMNNNLIKNEY
jgi:aminopeptidase-like protein